MVQDKIANYIDENHSKYISLIRELVKVSEKGEETLQQVIASKLSQLGCTVETLKLLPVELSPDKEFASEESIELTERVSIVGTYKGAGGGRSLMFFAHPDSEELKDLEKWRHEPFRAEVKNGKIYGWGVADDLLGVATMIGALDATHGTDSELKGDLFLCSTASKRNARGVTAVLNNGYKADAAIYLHPAESGEGLKEIKAFASGLLNFKIIVKGMQPKTTEPGHTVFSHKGVNPFEKTLKLIDALKEFDSKRGAKIRNPSLHEAVGRSTNLLISYLNYGDPKRLSRMTDTCEIGISISFPPEENMNELKKNIQSILEDVAMTDPWLRQNPPHIDWVFGTQGVETSINHPLYQVVNKMIEKVTGNVPRVNPLHTASDIRNPILFSGIPTVGFGSLAGDLAQTGRQDEWIDIKDYIKAITVCASIVREWCM
jgi:acetylornithine deacetylase